MSKLKMNDVCFSNVFLTKIDRIIECTVDIYVIKLKIISYFMHLS